MTHKQDQVRQKATTSALGVPLSCSNEDSKMIDLAKHDSLHFRELYEKYQHKVFNYFFYRVGRDLPLAEDLTQETFLRAFNALAHFEDRNIHYSSYLIMVAHNLLVNYYRMSKPILLDDMSRLSVHTESMSEGEAELSLLWDAVHHLPPVDQDVLTMKYAKDYPVKEIAKRLHKSVNSIKLHLTRARKKLRELF